MLKIVDPYTSILLGDMRIVKCGDLVFVQEYVPWGWEYTQLHNKQTLTSCIAEIIGRGYTYTGRDEDNSVYYYRNPQAGTAKLGHGSTRDSQTISDALASIRSDE